MKKFIVMHLKIDQEKLDALDFISIKKKKLAVWQAFSTYNTLINKTHFHLKSICKPGQKVKPLCRVVIPVAISHCCKIIHVYKGRENFS